jgi:hypothetical protein
MTQAGQGSRSAATPDDDNGVIYQGIRASDRVMVVPSPARVPAHDRSESARAGSEKSLQIIFPIE